jgi:hypothetical protein
MCPQKLKIGDELPTPANPTTCGTQYAGKPSAHEGGKTGVQGAKPHGGGLWGVSPPRNQKRGELPTLATSPRVGPKTLANPKPTGVGKRGSRGEAPWRGAVVGAPFRPNPLTPFPAKERENLAGLSGQPTSGT